MGLLYSFVSLDQAQLARRRRLLDNYGQFAQISGLIIPLLGFQLFFAVRFVFRKVWKSNHGQKRKERQSPRVSSFPKSVTEPSNSAWARFRWALDEQVYPEWGTRQEWLVGALWTMWLLLLVVKDTGDDYLHVTKRFGIVAASQLPLHYLLAAKSWSPVQYLTRMSHEELNPYHRLLGRIVIAFFSVHAAMYLNFFVQSSLLAKRIQNRDVILGLIAISSMLVLGTTALSKIRTYSYRLFLTLHVLLSISVLPTLYFHVSHLRVYILESVAIYVLLILQRKFSTTSAIASISCLPSSSLISISIKSDTLAKRKFTPGQHIYLSLPATSAAPLNVLRINPFTIANLPAPDGYMHLVIRPISGTTRLLADLAQNSYNSTTELQIEGPYGAAPYFPDLRNSYGRVLLVAGGVGATFTLPIYRDLLRHAREDNSAPSHIRFVWSVRDVGDAAWGIKCLQDNGDDALPQGFEVYVSGPPLQQQQDISTEGGQLAEDSIELQERHQLLPATTGEHSPGEPSTIEGEGNAGSSVTHMRPGRPDLKTIVDDTFSARDDDSDVQKRVKVAVLVCGPVGMGDALRTHVGRWVGRGRDVFWHNEGFGW
ncbi:Ferric reductase like transmembrane component [Pseudocyphellaria aurata]|nr:Ferric reductase like transmembrane component [Pseudocyphellaria aurata]